MQPLPPSEADLFEGFGLPTPAEDAQATQKSVDAFFAENAVVPIAPAPIDDNAIARRLQELERQRLEADKEKTLPNPAEKTKKRVTIQEPEPSTKKAKKTTKAPPLPMATDDEFIDDDVALPAVASNAPPIFVPVKSTKRRRVIGDNLALESSSPNLFNNSVDWQDAYLKYRIMLERGGELIPLAVQIERIQGAVKKFAQMLQWENSTLHTNKCPSRMHAILYGSGDGGHHDVHVDFPELLNRIENRTHNMLDVHFDPHRKHAMSREEYNQLEDVKIEDVIGAYAPNSRIDRLRFQLPLVPEEQLDVLSGFEDREKLPDAPEYFAQMSLETMSTVCESSTAIWKSLANLWTGPGVSLMESFKMPVVFFHQQVGEVTNGHAPGLAQQYREVLLFLSQLYAVPLPSLRSLLAKSSDDSIDAALFNMSKIVEARRCFPTDDAYTLFVYQHLLVLNAAAARCLCESGLLLPSDEKLQPRLEALSVPSLEHLKHFVRSYVHFRYVYAHRMASCAAAFLDYVYGPEMRSVLYTPLAMNPRVKHTLDGTKAIRSSNIRVDGKVRINPNVLVKLRELVTDVQLGEHAHLTPSKIYAIALIRSYYGQLHNDGGAQTLVSYAHLPVGMLADAVFLQASRNIPGKQPAYDKVFAWLHQPLEFYCELQQHYDQHTMASGGDKRPPWEFLAAHARSKVALAPQVLSHAKSSTLDRPYSDKDVQTLINMLDDNITAHSYSTTNSGAMRKAELLPAFLAFFNHKHKRNVFPLNAYGVKKISAKIYAAGTSGSHNTLYTINAKSEFSEWLAKRNVKTVGDRARDEWQRAQDANKEAARNAVLGSQALDEIIEQTIDQTVTQTAEEMVSPKRKRRPNGYKPTPEEILKMRTQKAAYMRLVMRTKRQEKYEKEGRVPRVYRATDAEKRQRRKEKKAPKQKRLSVAELAEEDPLVGMSKIAREAMAPHPDAAM